ncbi:MAG: YezD family protein [Deltaproteobacteria bacterium]|nr:YezD family protein [Deltaproteobacteria bacterium]
MEKDAVTEDIERAIKGIRFGSVQIIIQDARVVQIDKTEKIRLDSMNAKKGGDAPRY